MTDKKRMSKPQIIKELTENTGLSKKDVQAVFTALTDLIKRELGDEGPGEFLIPDMLKLKVKQVAAQPERQGIDPFTKQERTFPAKPASKRIRATAVKKFKDLVL
jgi:nucleoid DNA-binding protein